MEASPSYYKTVAMACGAVVAAYTAYSMATKKKQSEGTYQLMDGNAVKKAVLEEITEEVAKMKAEHGIVPGLAVRCVLQQGLL